MRGYGLVGSPQVDGEEPGKMLNLTAVGAPNEAAAAQYYPAIYWYAMLPQIPEQSQFGSKSDIPEKLTQIDWLKRVKNIGCVTSPVGSAVHAHVPAGTGGNSSRTKAWIRRIQAGQSGEQMLNQLAKNFGGAPFKYYADWTERIAKGELPYSKPTRPQGNRA